MRLIDADKLMTELKMNIVEVRNPEILEGILLAIERIKDQPTAFDAEKVIKQLEEERDYSYEDYENYAGKHDMDVECDDLFCRGLDRAIEIVKRGGMDEE